MFPLLNNIYNSITGGYIMRYFQKIVGERLYLSPVNPDDAALF